MLTSDFHQRLARYEAMLSLLTHMLQQDSIEAVAKAVADRWKYCASITCWRLVMEDDDDRFLVIDCDKSEIAIAFVARDDLDPADAKRYAKRLPERLSGNEIAAAVPSLAQHLCPAPVRQLVILPLGERQQMGRGLLYAGVADQTFDKLDLKFIAQIGSFLAYQIDASRRRRQAVEALRASSLIDSLTQIPNRRKFDEQLAIEWSAAGRKSIPLSLLMIDIDHFKQYNDRFGHVAGDACLKSVATAIAQGVNRASDLSARFGGEEFAVLLPETNSEGAAVVAERIIDAVRALSIPHFVDGRERVVTISVGCATATPVVGELSATLVKAADAALYDAKRQGRDRCVVSSVASPSAAAALNRRATDWR